MKNLVASILIFACLIVCQSGSAQFLEQNCGVRAGSESLLKPKIIDGSNAEITSSPWMAYLHTSPDFVCSGTLIHNQFVLTAAHCIRDRETLKVRLGDYNRRTSTDCSEAEAGCLPPAEEYDVDMAIKNRFYNRNVHPNDIGLLRLARKVQFKMHIRPICLIMDPRVTPMVETLSWFNATGWGKTRSGSTSAVLQTITLDRYRRNVCNDQFRVSLATNQFCAGHRTGNLCNGDSGGPLGRVVKYKGLERYVQFGIASYTTRNCVGPSVYTGVVSHAEWIARVIKLFNNPAPTNNLLSSQKLEGQKTNPLSRKNLEGERPTSEDSDAQKSEEEARNSTDIVAQNSLY
ncbi:serine protease grass-like [Drosophila pseudoobscura]|uniref:Serine protease grass-like n=1 Tax=Drosophila pseudoobscura pseudoobscura TaxID=46245 RepID=A0A6I8V549_DROPS|nr:serine protease grass [Drosophila pseudoobscura]